MSLDALIDELVSANHILYEEGVVDGFGHVSARHATDPARFLLAKAKGDRPLSDPLNGLVVCPQVTRASCHGVAS
jgi:hypothetical protein